VLLGFLPQSTYQLYAQYQNFVREGIGFPPVWESLKRQVFLGDEPFVDKVIETVDSPRELSEVPRMQRRKQVKSLAWYEEHFSLCDDTIVNAYVSGDYLMKVIADWFKVHYSTVSQVIKKAEIDDCKT
jgi:putative transposase